MNFRDPHSTLPLTYLDEIKQLISNNNVVMHFYFY